MYFAIDGRKLIRQPHSVEIAPGAHDVSMTGDGRPLVRPGSPYVQINCTFGSDFSFEDVMAELRRLRANRGVHSITFEDLRLGDRLTLNAYMGAVTQNHV